MLLQFCGEISFQVIMLALTLVPWEQHSFLSLVSFRPWMLKNLIHKESRLVSVPQSKDLCMPSRRVETSKSLSPHQTQKSQKYLQWAKTLQHLNPSWKRTAEKTWTERTVQHHRYQVKLLLALMRQSTAKIQSITHHQHCLAEQR